MTMPVAAPDECKKAVRIVAQAMASRGLAVECTSEAANQGACWSDPTAWFKKSRPKKIMPMPVKIFPVALSGEHKKAKPAAVRDKVITPGFTAINWTVKVVPVFAPRMTAMAWLRLSRRLCTRPTVITETAVLLWVRALVKSPTRNERMWLAEKECKAWTRRRLDR